MGAPSSRKRRILFFSRKRRSFPAFAPPPSAVMGRMFQLKNIAVKLLQFVCVVLRETDARRSRRLKYLKFCHDLDANSSDR
jgi:hypothetical protein